MDPAKTLKAPAHFQMVETKAKWDVYHLRVRVLATGVEAEDCSVSIDDAISRTSILHRRSASIFAVEAMEDIGFLLQPGCMLA